ncbi:hypothetical protein ACE6H2_005972 [Prunus campanulata]
MKPKNPITKSDPHINLMDSTATTPPHSRSGHCSGPNQPHALANAYNPSLNHDQWRTAIQQTA